MKRGVLALTDQQYTALKGALAAERIPFETLKNKLVSSSLSTGGIEVSEEELEYLADELMVYSEGVLKEVKDAVYAMLLQFRSEY